MAYDLLVEEVERLKLNEQKKKEADSVDIEKEAAGSVQMPEDQAMSPYAPPEADVVKAEQPAVPSQDLVEDLEMPALGPLGRGIIDGLGGIRDAAALAAEVFLVSFRDISIKCQY